MRNWFLYGVVLAGLLIIPFDVAAQTCVEPPSGLVSWWPAEGTAEDVAGDNDGVLQGGASFGAGVVGSAFVFDGFDDRILVADDPSLEVQQISIEGWVETSTVNDLFIAAKSGTTGLFGYEFGTFSSGESRFLMNGGSDGADIIGTTNNSNGLFHHIAATYDGTVLSIYVDGALQARRVVQTSIDYQIGAPFLIGSRQFGAIPGFWSGAIDELSVYSRGLCSTEIEAIYNAGSAGKCFGGTPVNCDIFLDDFEDGNTGSWSTTVP